MPNPNSLTDLGDAIRALIVVIAHETTIATIAEIAPHLASRDNETIDAARFAADHLGTARQFADAARLGAFPTFKGGATGRARIAQRADVLAWLATRTTKRAPRPANDTTKPSTFADAYEAIASGM